MSTTRYPSLAILIAITAIGPLALNIFIPSMPGMQAVFQVDYATIQLTLTLYLAGTAVAQLFMGPLSDRFGRRPVLLAGLALFFAGSVAASLSTSIETLILSRIIQAVGGSTGMVLGRAIVRDLYDREAAASKIAYITMAMVVVPMLAPTLGGFLDVWFNWRAGFITVTVISALILVWAIALLHETHHDRQPMPGLTGMLSSYAALLREPAFCGYAINMAFTSAMFFSFLAGAPYIMVELLDRTPSEYGLYFILISLGYMSGNFGAGRLSQRLGTQRMLVLGSVFSLLGVFVLLGLALAHVFTPLAIFAPMTMIAIANGLSLPNSTAGAVSVNPRAIGAASGLAGFLQIAIGALATFVVGSLQADSQWPMIWAMFASAWIALIGFGIALITKPQTT